MYFSVRRLDLGDAVMRMAVFGTVDEATSDVLMAAIRHALATNGLAELVIDLGGTTSLDHYGVAALEAGEKLALRSGVDFRVVNAPVQVTPYVTRIISA